MPFQSPFQPQAPNPSAARAVQIWERARHHRLWRWLLGLLLLGLSFHIVPTLKRWRVTTR